MNHIFGSPVHAHIRSAVDSIAKAQNSRKALGITDYSIDQGALKALAFYAAVCIIKNTLVLFWIAYLGYTRQEEESKFFARDRRDVIKHLNSGEDVQRASSCQQNYTKSVIPFILLGLFLVLTGANYYNAVMHFRIFTLATILYDVCYLFVLPAPSKTACFLVGNLTNLSMAIQIFIATMT